MSESKPGRTTMLLGIAALGTSAALCGGGGLALAVLAARGGTAGLGWGIQLRHEIRTDEPGLTWRVEHGVLRGSVAADRLRGAVYEGRFLRHSREGYLLFPGSPPRRVPVPFDVGLETAAGRVEGRRSQDELRLTAVRGALLVDLARSDTFRRRAALGTVARWDLRLDRERQAIVEQSVAPFSVGMLGLYAESADGLTLASLSSEAGYATLGKGGGWRPLLAVELTVERTLLAVNDHPLNLYATGRFEERIDHIAARIACHASIRSGETMTREEAYALLHDLERSELSGACPHGRPVIVSFDRMTVEQWFGRDR